MLEEGSRTEVMLRSDSLWDARRRLDMSRIVYRQLDEGIVGFKHGHRSSLDSIESERLAMVRLLWQRLSAGRLTRSRGVHLASKNVVQVAKR
jgi:hypothetical protein